MSCYGEGSLRLCLHHDDGIEAFHLYVIWRVRGGGVPPQTRAHGHSVLWTFGGRRSGLPEQEIRRATGICLLIHRPRRCPVDHINDMRCQPCCLMLSSSKEISA